MARKDLIETGSKVKVQSRWEVIRRPTNGAGTHTAIRGSSRYFGRVSCQSPRLSWYRYRNRRWRGNQEFRSSTRSSRRRSREVVRTSSWVLGGGLETRFVLINAIRTMEVVGMDDARYRRRQKRVATIPSVLLEMTTFRRTLQTRETDNQKLKPSEDRRWNLFVVVAAEAALFACWWIVWWTCGWESRVDSSSRWLRRTNQVVLELDSRLAGKKHRDFQRWELFVWWSRDMRRSLNVGEEGRSGVVEGQIDCDDPQLQ